MFVWTLDYATKVAHTVDDDRIIYEIISNELPPIRLLQGDIDQLIDDTTSFRPFNRYAMLTRFLSLANDNKIIGDVRKTFENVRLRDFLHSSLRNILNFHLENVWPTVGVCANDVNLLQPICLSDLNITSLNPLYRARQTMRDELIQTDSEQLPMVNVSVSNNNNNNNNGLPIDPNRNRLMLSLIFDDDRVY